MKFLDKFNIKRCPWSALGYFIIGFALGFLCFVFMYGIKVLNVTYDAFLINQRQDLTQNYLGWVFYRFASYEHGLGMMDTLTYPHPVSLIYTDSIPLFELILKPFSAILPSTFQYWGIYGVMSFTLSGGISALILRKWTEKWYLICIGILPFILAVPVILKMWYFHSLSAQWLLLLAFYLWICHKEKWQQLTYVKTCLLWLGMGILSCSLHIYFVPMTGMILLGYIVHMCLECYPQWKLAFCVLLSYLSGVLLFMLLTGGFQTDFYLEETYFEKYIDMLYVCGANLNSFLNAWTPTVFGKSYSMPLKGQGEGIAYLGAGVITAIILSLLIRIRHVFDKEKRKNITKKPAFRLALGLVFFISMVVAIGPVVTFWEHTLFTIPYPRFLLELWCTFRCTGRFIWVAFYLLILFAEKTLLTLEKGKWMQFAFMGCCILQVVDLSPTFQEQNKKYNQYEAVHTKLTEEAWDILGERFDHAVVLPNTELNRRDPRNDFGYWAGRYQLTLNDFYLARMIRKDQTPDYLALLQAGNADKHTVYIVQRQLLPSFMEAGLYWYQVDDYYVGTVEDISVELNKKAIDRVFLTAAEKEWIQDGKDYSSVFDPIYYYYRYYGELQSPNMTPEELWQDFMEYGIEEGRKGSKDFDVRKYRERYPDLETKYGDDWRRYLNHYVYYGKEEKRLGY